MSAALPDIFSGLYTVSMPELLLLSNRAAREALKPAALNLRRKAMIKKTLLMVLSVLLALGVASVLAQDSGAGEKGKAVGSAKNKDVTEPVLVSKVDPAYPPDAKNDKVIGAVVLEVTIGADGSVVEAKAVKSPDPRLAQAAIDAVKQWKFKPAKTKAGKAIQVLAHVTVNFRLK